MKHLLVLRDKHILYTIRKHPKAKRIRLRISENGELVVTTPPRIPRMLVTALLRLNAEAIAQKVAQLPEHIASSGALSRRAARQRYEAHKEQARQLAQERLVALNMNYGYTYKRISIRDQKTRWGSCSKKGNLNFSYKIALLPPHLADYIIAHELCHLGAFDHSSGFWNLVAQTIPDHKACRKELRSFRLNSENSPMLQ